MSGKLKVTGEIDRRRKTGQKERRVEKMKVTGEIDRKGKAG